MAIPTEISDALHGAWRLACLDRRGMAYFARGEAAFWRSFRAAVILYPVFLIMLALRPGDAESPSARGGRPHGWGGRAGCWGLSPAARRGVGWEPCPNGRPSQEGAPGRGRWAPRAGARRGKAPPPHRGRAPCRRRPASAFPPCCAPGDG